MTITPEERALALQVELTKRKEEERALRARLRDTANAEAWKSQMGERPLRKRFNNYNATTPRQIKVKEAIETNFNKSFLFLGNTGCGKTHLGFALANKYIEEFIRINQILPITEIVRCITEVDMALEFTMSKRFDWREDTIGVKEYYETIPFLMLDEIGRNKNNEEFKVLLNSIIDYRYENELQTVLISNLNETAITTEFGLATMDRIRGMAIQVNFDWTSYRENIII